MVNRFAHLGLGLSFSSFFAKVSTRAASSSVAVSPRSRGAIASRRFVFAAVCCG